MTGPAPILDYRTPEKRKPWYAMALREWLLCGVLIILISAFFFAMFSPPSRERANRVKCAQHLRQIGQALALYANDNGGSLPPRLDVLLNDPTLDPGIFCCPVSKETPPTGPTTQAVIASFNQPGRCSYAYFGGSINGTPTADMVLAMENPANHSGEGMNILFGDGHAEWADPKEAARIRAELEAGHNPPRPK